jgi:hypothetical protein
MKQILQAIGFGTLATAIIGGIVVAVSLLDHRSVRENDIPDEASKNQLVETEEVRYAGWEEKNQEFFEDIVEHDGAYHPCYCTLYADGYASFMRPITCTNDEFDEVIVQPWKVKEQDYVPYEFIEAGGYFIDHNHGDGWAIRHAPYDYPLVYRKEYDGRFIDGEVMSD